MNNTNQNNTELVQYVRISRGSRKGQARGVVVAIKDEEKGYKVGWSFTKINAGDVFDKQFGLTLARNRATLQRTESKTVIPADVLPVIKSMTDRADRYFKIEE